MAYDEEEGKISQYNAADLKMRRLDKELSDVNNLNGNLFAWNYENGVWNFELKFARCNSLYQEVESKLKKEERNDGEKMKEAIELALKKWPVFKKTHGKKIIADKKMQELIRKWLFKYETLIRKFIDDHGMDTRYDDLEGL